MVGPLIAPYALMLSVHRRGTVKKRAGRPLGTPPFYRSFRRLTPGSEADPERQLHDPRRVGDVRVRERLAKIRSERVGPVVADVPVVEQVEHFDNPVNPHLPNVKPPHQSHVHPVNRVALHGAGVTDRAIGL